MMIKMMIMKIFKMMMMMATTTTMIKYDDGGDDDNDNEYDEMIKFFSTIASNRPL